jgi:hydrogenase/urease accessory protein HupE
MRWASAPVTVAIASAIAWLAITALAHQGGTTGYATVSVDGQAVRFALALPAEGLGEVTRDLREFAAAMARHVSIEADGSACSGVPAETRPPSAGRARIEIVVLYACPGRIRTLTIRDGSDALLGADHHTIADIQWPGGAKQVVFEKGQRLASIEMGGNAARDSGSSGKFSFFVGLGIEHIIGGIDHLLFLLALLALSTSLWQTVKIVTAFTVAHSITLSLAVLGLVHVPSSIVEPLIAASIVWVAVENLVAPAGAGRRWLIAGIFGLVHGLGFATALAELGLSRDTLVRALVGFNVGVELGQLAFVVVILPPLVWASRPGRLPRLPQVLSVIVAVVGAVWLVERLLAA